MKGILPWLARRAGTMEFCPSLAAPVNPVQNIIFLTKHFFTLLVPITQQSGHWTGSRAGSPVSVFLGGGEGDDTRSLPSLAPGQLISPLSDQSFIYFRFSEIVAMLSYVNSNHYQ